MIKFDLSVVTQIKPSELHIKKTSDNYSPKTKLSKKNYEMYGFRSSVPGRLQFSENFLLERKITLQDGK